jgi:hypothetical protein
MHKNTRNIMGKPFSNKGEKSSNPLLYSQENIPQPQTLDAHKRVLYNLENSAQERCALHPYK